VSQAKLGSLSTDIEQDKCKAVEFELKAGMLQKVEKKRNKKLQTGIKC